jgi:hypothetical protein
MKTLKKTWIALACLFGIGAVIITAIDVLADSIPVLTIAPTGTNQFQITVANGTNTGNYELYWTPVLGDANYPFSLLIIGNQGQTNFTVDAGTVPNAFFQVIAGTDWDGDGVVNWQDANPNDPSIGILTVIIDSPTNHSVLN